MVHAAEQVIRVLDDLVATFAFDMGNETHAAAVVLELGPIQPLCRREAGGVLVTHARRPSCRKSNAGTRTPRPFRRAGSRQVRVRRSYSHGSTQRSAALAPHWLVLLAGRQLRGLDLSSGRPFDLPRRGPAIKGRAGLKPTPDYMKRASATSIGRRRCHSACHR